MINPRERRHRLHPFPACGDMTPLVPVDNQPTLNCGSAVGRSCEVEQGS
jgi:hypothetical protein